MSNALNLLRAMRASKAAAVAGVLQQPVISAAEALDRRAVAAESVVTESRRIRALPRWDILAMSKQAEPGGPLDYTSRLRLPGGTFQLSVVQNLALYWAEEKKGLVGPLAVGSGKGWLSLFIPMVMGALRPVLFIPNNMQIPLRREMEKLAKHFKLPKNLYIIPYSQLSVAKSTDILDQLKPDLIVCDEVHNIKNPDAARSRRVLRYFREHPGTRFVALSGTLTSKSLRDYAHLCEIALREGTPLPTDEADLIAWSNCVDSKGIPQEKDWSLFSTFVDLRNIEDPALRQEKAREHFKDRFTTTPGVVATSEASVSCSLNLLERKVVVPDAVTQALYDLNESWMRPDGEVMRDAIALWRLGMQMAEGHWLRWVWPEGVVDHEWLNARSAWFKEVRAVCQRNIVGMDSPFLVWQSMMHGRLTDPSLLRAWVDWERVKDRPKPPTETVWIDDFLIRDALDWRKHHPKGIIWHSDLATEYALRAAGVPTYGKGEVAPEDGSKGGIALSIRVHGTGLNLQYAHHENLILSFPSSGKTVEQLLGRTHRQGQEADEVNCWYYAHVSPARQATTAAKADAAYIQQTHGSPQKLCYCTYI